MNLYLQITKITESVPAYATPLIFGVVAFLLLINYDTGKALKKYLFFVRNWNKILIISNIGFLLTFIHALKLGGDLQNWFMRGLWIFCGVTALLSIIYTYAFKRR